MNDDLLATSCDALISSLLKIKRGELEREQVVETLERIKDSTDTLIRCIEFDVAGEIHGC